MKRCCDCRYSQINCPTTMILFSHVADLYKPGQVIPLNDMANVCEYYKRKWWKFWR
jgi:hypothetical protein